MLSRRITYSVLALTATSLHGGPILAVSLRVDGQSIPASTVEEPSEHSESAFINDAVEEVEEKLENLLHGDDEAGAGMSLDEIDEAFLRAPDDAHIGLKTFFTALTQKGYPEDRVRETFLETIGRTVGGQLTYAQWGQVMTALAYQAQAGEMTRDISVSAEPPQQVSEVPRAGTSFLPHTMEEVEEKLENLLHGDDEAGAGMSFDEINQAFLDAPDDAHIGLKTFFTALTQKGYPEDRVRETFLETIGRTVGGQLTYAQWGQVMTALAYQAQAGEMTRDMSAQPPQEQAQQTAQQVGRAPAGFYTLDGFYQPLNSAAPVFRTLGGIYQPDKSRTSQQRSAAPVPRTIGGRSQQVLAPWRIISFPVRGGGYYTQQTLLATPAQQMRGVVSSSTATPAVVRHSARPSPGGPTAATLLSHQDLLPRTLSVPAPDRGLPRTFSVPVSTTATPRGFAVAPVVASRPELLT